MASLAWEQLTNISPPVLDVGTEETRERELVNFASKYDAVIRDIRNSIWFANINVHYKSADSYSEFIKSLDTIEYMLFELTNTTVSYDSRNNVVEFRDKNGRLGRPDDHFSRIHISGRVEYFMGGKRSRIVGPAIIDPVTGISEFFWENKRHRFFPGPAIIDSIRHYYVYFENDVITRHVSEGPAVCWDNKIAYIYDGVIGRDPNDGPAYIDTSSTSVCEIRYYVHGQLSRENGPARIVTGTDKVSNKIEYWRGGVLDRPEAEGPAVKFGKGGFAYWRGGQLHSEDPERATVYIPGVGHAFYRNGKLSRDQKAGPALVLENGTKEYFMDGVRHREVMGNSKLPAVIHPDGSLEFWHAGVFRLRYPADGPTSPRNSVHEKLFHRDAEINILVFGFETL